MSLSDGPILITGSAGLIGTALDRALRAREPHAPAGLDLRGPRPGDVRSRDDLATAIAGCRGVVHLAAISRVIWGQADPEACRATNVGGTAAVLAAAAASAQRPWVLFASSREVYGQPERLPATEDTPVAPLNVYGRTKVEGEHLVLQARAAGLVTAVVRLCNVYGSPDDHADRVVPAFARAALAGAPLRVDGSGCRFDFTHLDDTVGGLVALIDRLDHRDAPPPLHLSTGVPTSLGELAGLAIELAGSRSDLVEAPPRSFDVPDFFADPTLAARLLGWRPAIALRDGLRRLLDELR